MTIQGRIDVCFSRSAAGNFASGLCWLMSGPCRRRVGFPSWSRTGWHGVPEDTSREWTLPYNMNPAISIELEPGIIMLLEEAFDMMPPTTLSSQYKSPKLKITTWATTITIVKFIGAEELHPILGGEEREPEQIKNLWINLKTAGKPEAFMKPYIQAEDVINKFE